MNGQRKFMMTGMKNPETWAWLVNPENNVVYTLDQMREMYGPRLFDDAFGSFEGFIEEFRKDGDGQLIEITDDQIDPKPGNILHKDTDLGYFSGLMVANGCMIDDAIYRAKELIKQLDKERENG